jgi:hypothetical protein
MVVVMVDVMLLQEAPLLLPPPLADNRYHLAVLPPPSSLQRGKDKGAGWQQH